MTQTDWPSLIDSSFDDGPAPGPHPAAVLAGGRRALRRRRTRRFAGVAAVLVVAGAPVLGGLVTGHDAETATDLQVTTSGLELVEGAAASRQGETSIVISAGPVTYDPTTETLTMPSGWQELGRVTSPLGVGSLAAEITDGTVTLFLCLTGEEGHSRGIVAVPDSTITSLQEFVDLAVPRLRNAPSPHGRG